MTRTLPRTKHLDAAAMLARDVPVTEIARQLNVSRPTVMSWCATQEAQDQIAAIKASVQEATKQLSVADKVRRINHAQEMLNGILELIAARRKAGAAESEAHRMPGEETGQVAIKDITIKGVRTKEATFDAALHNEMRKWLEYVAKEKGELETGVNVRHSGRVDHVIQRRDLSALSDDELDQLTELAQKIESGAVSA